MNDKICCFLFVFAVIVNINKGLSQKDKSFSGELIYMVTQVDASPNELIPSDNAEKKVIIYAKDSLLKIVNFNSVNGSQECLKHLKKNKTILLIELEGQGYAIRMDEDQNPRKDTLYSFNKKCGLKRNIGGLKSKKMTMNHPMLTNELICFYSKKIPSEYANVFEDLPGIPTVYYIVADDGLFRYELESYQDYDPPLSIFMIPEGFEIVTMLEFMDKVNSDK